MIDARTQTILEAIDELVKTKNLTFDQAVQITCAAHGMEVRDLVTIQNAMIQKAMEDLKIEQQRIDSALRDMSYNIRESLRNLGGILDSQLGGIAGYLHQIKDILLEPRDAS